MSVKQLLAAAREDNPVLLKSCVLTGPEPSWTKSPDVVVTGFRDVALLEAQTNAAASWLSARYETELGSAQDQLCMNSHDKHRIIKELQAAGFSVLSYHQD